LTGPANDFAPEQEGDDPRSNTTWLASRTVPTRGSSACGRRFSSPLHPARRSPLISRPNPERIAISERTIWLIAVGLIVLDLAVFMVPIVPILAAYVIVARPPWFKTFVDDLYGSQ
jgi:hypothetical protein